MYQGVCSSSPLCSETTVLSLCILFFHFCLLAHLLAISQHSLPNNQSAILLQISNVALSLTVNKICCGCSNSASPHDHVCILCFILSEPSVLWVYSALSHPCPPVPMLEHLCSALLYPDEALKASALSVWFKLFKTAGGSAAQSLPIAIRERVCILLLQTLTNASSPQLINKCVGEKKTFVSHLFI